MTKSELIEKLVIEFSSLSPRIIVGCVKEILEQMSSALENGKRIEVRGFGSFSLHYRQARLGRNPKTGEKVKLTSKYVPYFRAGKELKDRVDTFSK